MEHIFWAEKDRSGYYLPEDEMNHVLVVRINLPSRILFTSGDGLLYSGMADKSGRITDFTQEKETEKTNIDIMFGLCDKSRINYILEKCTELGIDSFTPLITERSEKHPLNKERAQRIIVSALKQSRRFSMPEYREQMKINEISETNDTQIIFGSIKESKKKIELNRKKILLIIGPPLGFTENEEKILIQKKAEPFHFDTGILRTETFAVSLLSIIHYIKGAKSG